MTDYSDAKKKVYLALVKEPNGRVRVLNQMQVIYDEGSSNEVSAWEQLTDIDDYIFTNPTGSTELVVDGVRFFDILPQSDVVRLTG